MSLTLDFGPVSGTTYTGPNMNPDNSGGFFGGLNALLGTIGNSNFGAAYGAGLASRPVTDGSNAVNLNDPTRPATGRPNQPGTNPPVNIPTVWQKVWPYVAIAGGILTLAALYRLVFRK